jgi:hypothetical protein
MKIGNTVLAIAVLYCNQVLFDQLYRQIIVNLINNKQFTQEQIDQKNDAIELLRKLCNGQKSSYELGRKI